jgi:hypothetical protein
MNADGRKKEYIRTAIVLAWPRPPLFSISQLAQCPCIKKFSFLFGHSPISYSSLFSTFLFFWCMFITDGHMCQNWHRWEEWWRPSTVTWERKTIRIEYIRWTCYAIRQTKRVKGTWQIFNLNKKKRRKIKYEHRY